MKIHIFALRWRDEIRRSLQLRTLLKLVVVNRTWKKFRPVQDLNPWPLHMKIHIFALRWGDEIRRSSQLRTLLKLVVVSRTWKKIQARTGFEPMTSAIPVQHSTNWANKPTGSWSMNWVQIQRYVFVLSTRFVRTSGNSLSQKKLSRFLFAQHLEANLLLWLWCYSIYITD